MSRTSLLRHLLRSKPIFSAFPSNPCFCYPSNKTLNTVSSSFPLNPLSNPTSHHFPKLFFANRNLCSSTSPSNIVLIKSEDEFKKSLNKVKDECLPAIFYFTAAWCGPCKFISPVIEELSKKFSHVNTYKIDIDQEGLQDTLSELKIYSVPTLHFFQNGKKATEIIGADIARLKDTMENLYKKE